MADDELSVRRKQVRREATLRAMKVHVRLRWYPAWEFEVRATGPWWFVISAVLASMSIGVLLTTAVAKLVNWSIAGDWRMLAVAFLAWALVVLWAVVAVVRVLGSSDDNEDTDR